VPGQAAAVRELQLPQHRRDVALDGARRDEQGVGDLRVRQVPGDQGEHLGLAGRHVASPGLTVVTRSSSLRRRHPVVAIRAGSGRPCRHRVPIVPARMCRPVAAASLDLGADPPRRIDSSRERAMTTMPNVVRNGVDTATLFATLDAVKGDTDLAKFQFRATNRWVAGPTTGRRSTASTAPSRR
jgi:hypothetical protein